jgi:hypothetical protein
MGETGRKRLGRTLGYSRAALLSGAGAALIALLMVGSATAASASVVTVHPAYHGVVAPFNSVSAQGCATTAKIVKKANFHLHTGIGAIDFNGKAGNCGAKLPKGFTFYDDASAAGGFEAVIKLPSISANAQNVSANLAGKYSWTATVSTGGSSIACPSGLDLYVYNYTSWEWGYNASTFTFANSAYSTIDYQYYGGTWYSYNSSYNVASVPSPFYLNNTTYYDHYSFSEVYSSGTCDASVSGSTYSYVEVCDTTTGSCYTAEGGAGAYDAFWGMSVSNSTFWEPAHSSNYWDGPTNYGYNYSYAAYNGNTSGTSWYNENIFYTSPYYNYTSGTNATATSMTMSGSNVLTGQSRYLNLSAQSYVPAFVPTDHYFLIYYIDTSMYATNSNWHHGSASFAFNGATLGNGIKLASITIA